MFLVPVLEARNFGNSSRDTGGGSCSPSTMSQFSTGPLFEVTWANVDAASSRVSY
jgi:hypothetical protein